VTTFLVSASNNHFAMPAVRSLQNETISELFFVCL